MSAHRRPWRPLPRLGAQLQVHQIADQQLALLLVGDVGKLQGRIGRRHREVGLGDVGPIHPGDDLGGVGGCRRRRRRGRRGGRCLGEGGARHQGQGEREGKKAFAKR